ncbi:MAG: DUF5615 family PIN-like protein [Acidobacteria bacterium]|nr:DUF5615 family PIN-like protein [Acidobacteriota bacterium]
MKISLYFDEDSQDTSLMRALRLRGVAVTSSAEVGNNGYRDEVHLEWATLHRQVLFTFNAQDFCRLHALYRAQGKAHAGIIVALQQQDATSEPMRRLLKLIAIKSAAELQNQLEFLSAWP